MGFLLVYNVCGCIAAVGVGAYYLHTRQKDRERKKYVRPSMILRQDMDASTLTAAERRQLAATAIARAEAEGERAGEESRRVFGNLPKIKYDVCTHNGGQGAMDLATADKMLEAQGFEKRNNGVPGSHFYVNEFRTNENAVYLLTFSDGTFYLETCLEMPVKASAALLAAINAKMEELGWLPKEDTNENSR